MHVWSTNKQQEAGEGKEEEQKQSWSTGGKGEAQQSAFRTVPAERTMAVLKERGWEPARAGGPGSLLERLSLSTDFSWLPAAPRIQGSRSGCVARARARRGGAMWSPIGKPQGVLYTTARGVPWTPLRATEPFSQQRRPTTAAASLRPVRGGDGAAPGRLRARAPRGARERRSDSARGAPSAASGRGLRES
ncbi:unnamed protein product, partial [Prorocentrum cordatum]